MTWPRSRAYWGSWLIWRPCDAPRPVRIPGWNWSTGRSSERALKTAHTEIAGVYDAAGVADGRFWKLNRAAVRARPHSYAEGMRDRCEDLLPD